MMVHPKVSKLKSMHQKDDLKINVSLRQFELGLETFMRTYSLGTRTCSSNSLREILGYMLSWEMI